MHALINSIRIIIVCVLFLGMVSTVTADVFFKSKGSINQIIDKMDTTLVYSSELEVNGEPGSISIYKLHEYNALSKLAKYLKLDSSMYSEDGFRVKLTKEQGDGMIFAIGDGGSFNDSGPIVLHFISAEKSTPKWIFPELTSPAESKIQFSVKDATRNMRMCIYLDDASANIAMDNMRNNLIKNGWECVTPGKSSTCLFFAREDSVILVAATPSHSDLIGTSILIMEKK